MAAGSVDGVDGGQLGGRRGQWTAASLVDGVDGMCHSWMMVMADSYQTQKPG